MPPVGFEPTISAGERPQAAHLLKSCCAASLLCCVVVCDLETSRIGAPYIYISNLRVKYNRNSRKGRPLCYQRAVRCTARYHARHNSKRLIFCGTHSTEYHLSLSEVLIATLLQVSGSNYLKENAKDKQGSLGVVPLIHKLDTIWR